MLTSPLFYLISKPPEYYKRSHQSIEDEKEKQTINNKTKPDLNKKEDEEPKKKKIKYEPQQEFDFTNLQNADQLFLNSYFTNPNYQIDLENLLKEINFEQNSFINPFLEEKYDLFTPKV